ncbi:hypothetical protein ACVJBD_005845 [Rhizobium mongolense]
MLAEVRKRLEITSRGSIGPPQPRKLANSPRCNGGQSIRGSPAYVAGCLAGRFGQVRAIRGPWVTNRRNRWLRAPATRQTCKFAQSAYLPWSFSPYRSRSFFVCAPCPTRLTQAYPRSRSGPVPIVSPYFHFIGGDHLRQPSSYENGLGRSRRDYPMSELAPSERSDAALVGQPVVLETIELSLADPGWIPIRPGTLDQQCPNAAISRFRNADPL